jgi:cell division protein FtsI (penicillin-binding protein 3)
VNSAISSARLRLAVLFVAGLAGLVVLRLFYLQVIRGSFYASVAQNQAQEQIEVDLPRATLLDRNGTILAASTLCPSLFTFDPQKIADPSGLAREIALLSGRDFKEILRSLQSRKGFTWLARKLPFDRYPAAKSLCDRFPGVEIMDEAGRFYPCGELAANLIGCMGMDGGLAGLEHQWNDQLKGGTRRYAVQRDAFQTTLIPIDLVPEVDQPPRAVRLTLDAAIQQKTQEVLAKTVQEMNARDGVAIVMNPKNGDVLAMATCPTFDPNEPGKSPSAHWRNRAVTDSFEPGSTFKVVTLAAGLDSGRFQPYDTVIVGGGALTVGPKTIHDDHPPHSSVYTVEDVLAYSSNVGAARIGMAVGERTLYQYMRQFGFGEVTALGMKGEVAGRLRPVNEWSALSLPSLSFGQELRATPLQLTLAYATVASGGLKVIPRILLEHAGPPPDRILKESTCRALTQFLAKVVTEGTGKQAAVPGVRVCGKTGTAQKLGQVSPDGRKLFIAYFVGFAPAEDPRLVVSVMVDEPVGKIYGGAVSAPAFSQILAFGLKRTAYPERPPTVDLASLEDRR